MNRDEDRISAEAASWHCASVHDDMDWEGFTAWLEADPRHRSAYDEIALANSLIDDNRELLRAFDEETRAEVPPSAPGMVIHWWRRAGAAIAAVLVLAFAIPQFLPPAPQIYRTHDQMRTIALGDGSKVMLAPRSTLTVEGTERLALDGGAWFDIRHDPSRSLAIRAGQIEISDIGTQFDVQATGPQVRVAVGDGEVSVTSSALAQPLRLVRGSAMLFDAKGGTATISAIDGGDVGEWRRGRLTYHAAPLPLVAADLSRYAGVRVTVSDALRARRFSGSLVVGNGEAAIRDLAQVMDLELRRGSGGFGLHERQR